MFNSILIPLTRNDTTTNGLGLTAFIPLILVAVVMYFLMIRPQKKKEKKDAKMRSNLQVGDEVVTIGGIIGIVFSIKDDTVVIETGSDRSKIRVTKTAIYENKTVHETEAEITSTKKSKEE